MRLHWKLALRYMFESPTFKSACFWGGLILLICPPIGWPVALGYRSLTLRHLLDTGEVDEISLPRDIFKCFWSGMGAVVTIFIYYLPFLVLFWFLAVGPNGFILHWREAAIFFALIIFLIPVFLPFLPVIYAWQYSWIQFSSFEVMTLVCLFLLTTFIMPAVFMQVSLRGTYWGALQVGQVLNNVIACLAEYLEAWLLSLVLISLCFLIFPLFSWITFWSYLVIGMLFNNVLASIKRPEVAERTRLLTPRFS